MLFVLTVLLAGALAQTTGDAINANLDQLVQSYNANLNQVPSFVKAVLGDENLHIYFTTNAGPVYEYAAITQNGLITEAAVWADANGNQNHDPWEAKGLSPTMELRVTEATMTNIAQSSNPLLAFKNAWGSEIKFKPISLVANVKMFVANIGMFIAGFFLPQPAAKYAAGHVCQHGGECTTGYCLYAYGQGADRTYQCSCAQLTLVVQDPCTANPLQPGQGTNKGIGETCNHGGECASTYCVGVGQGPPWVYKCSCDAFRYDESCANP